MTEQQRKWLDLVRLASNASRGSPGEREDLVPSKVARWMERSGYVDRVIPHNPVHKERFVITDAGLDALKQ